jgi:hypothetical protein
LHKDVLPSPAVAAPQPQQDEGDEEPERENFVLRNPEWCRQQLTLEAIRLAKKAKTQPPGKRRELAYAANLYKSAAEAPYFSSEGLVKAGVVNPRTL